MAKARELKGRIRSVQNTRKITRTMEMVATSKLKRAQDRVAAARPYAERLGQVIGLAVGVGVTLLLYPDAEDFIAPFLGCLYAGVIAVPAYPPRPKRLGHLVSIAADAGISILEVPRLGCINIHASLLPKYRGAAPMSKLEYGSVLAASRGLICANSPCSGAGWVAQAASNTAAMANRGRRAFICILRQAGPAIIAVVAVAGGRAGRGPVRHRLRPGWLQRSANRRNGG